MRSMTIRLAIVAALIALAGAKVSARQPAASAPTATTTTAAKTSAQTTQPAIGENEGGRCEDEGDENERDEGDEDEGREVEGDEKEDGRESGEDDGCQGAEKAVACFQACRRAGADEAGTVETEQPDCAGAFVETHRGHAGPARPASGTDLNAATTGFRNYSQFAAAMNATESKGLDFGKLKALMTGVTMDGTRTNQPTMSLSQATQTLHGTATTPPGGSL